MIRDLARLLLPQAMYRWGSSLVRSRRTERREVFPPLGEAVFIDLLRQTLGLKVGDVVMVHSSVDQLHLGFSFMRVLPALRRAVGDEGTLLFPATQLRQRPEQWLARGEVFDVVRSPTAMGLLAEMARRQPDAVRSLHPTHSVVGIGPLAESLLAEHHLDIYPCGHRSPYFKLNECGGSFIGLGVDADVLTAVHCVEDIWQRRFPVQTRRAQPFGARVCDAAGNEVAVDTLVAHPRIRWRHMLAYMRERVGEDICRRFCLAGRRFYRADAAALFARIEALAQEGITMYSPQIYRGHVLEPLWSRLAEKLEER